MFLSSETRAQGGGIIVDGEDDKSMITNEYSTELGNVTSGVTSRVVMEYGDFGSKLGLNKSGELDQAASAVSSRVVAEYADSAPMFASQQSVGLQQSAATVTSRIIVEYADYATTFALSPYLGPLPYPNDTSPPNIVVTREPLGPEVNESNPVIVSANVTDEESGVKNATLQYTLDNSTNWSSAYLMQMSLNLTMQPQNSLALSFNSTIPGQPSGTRVRFRIVAYDFAGNSATIDGAIDPTTYLVVPEFPSTALLSLFAIATLWAAIVYRRKHSKYAR
jgi:hypothetical protein